MQNPVYQAFAESQTGVPLQYPYGVVPYYGVVGQQQFPSYYGVADQLPYGQLPYGVVGGDMLTYADAYSDPSSPLPYSVPSSPMPMPMPMPLSPLPMQPASLPPMQPASLPLLASLPASPSPNKRSRNRLLTSPAKRADPHVAYVHGTVIPPFPLARTVTVAPAYWHAGVYVAVYFETGWHIGIVINMVIKIDDTAHWRVRFCDRTCIDIPTEAASTDPSVVLIGAL